MLHKLKSQDAVANYIFCLVIGSIYIYSLAMTIFSATIIETGAVALFATGLVSIFIFLVVFYNRITILVSFALLVIFGLYIVYLVRADAYYPYFHPIITHFNQLFFVITGETPYDPALARTIVWAVCLLFGAIVATLMLNRSNFIVLATIGIAVFMLTWGPGFVRHQVGFLLFLFVFCVLLIRKMNDSAAATMMVAPLCAFAIVLIHINIPNTSDMFVRRQINQYLTRAGETVSDRIFEIFNPTYFSFQSTGFSGAGGRLGGPVTLNNRTVMDVVSPGGIYLSGATSNTFTGYSWIPTLNAGDIYTHGLTPGQFEMLETVAALIRGATIAQSESSISQAVLAEIAADARNLDPRHFSSIGVVAGNFYLHSYLPVDTVSIDMGRQRTGTIFRPINAWQLMFDPRAADYLPVTQVLPLGDMQAPGLMSRNTGYGMRFLNVDTQLGFIEEILRQSNRGIYAQRAEQAHWWLQHVTFGDYITGLDESADGWFDVRNILLKDLLLSFEEDFGIIDDDVWNLWFGDWDMWEDPRIPERIAQFAESDYFGIAQMQTLFDLFHSHVYVETQQSGAVSQFGPQILPGPVINVRHDAHIPHESYLLNWLDTFSASVLASYAQQVRYHFLDVPEIVPQRVHDLTMEIVHDKTNDFDRIIAIRDYLMQFPYTLNPVPVPRGVCFVDHFLFEGQEGYCTYFASAMAIMARIAGVPSRYVEGFVLPPSRYELAVTTVTNRMAHAWVEVYLEGFGWIIIEATPTYAFLMDPAQFIQSGMATGSLFEHIDWHNWNDWEDWDEWEDYWYDEHGTPPPWIGSTSETPNGYDEPEPIITPRNIRAAIQTVILVVLAAIALVALARFVQITYVLIKARRYAPNKKALIYFKGVLDLVAFATVPLAPGETPQAYGKHNGKRFKFKGGSVYFEDLITLYYKAKYSPHTIKESEGNLMEEAYFDMINFIRAKNKPIKVIYLRYVRGIGAI